MASSSSGTRAAAHASELEDPSEAVAKLAELILAAEHCVFVTGAGISTNAGIRDRLSSHVRSGASALHVRATRTSLLCTVHARGAGQLGPGQALPNACQPRACRGTTGDYRGPDGIWTEALAQGKVVGEPDAGGETPWDEAFYRLLPAARPTFTHLAITSLTLPSTGRAHPLVRHVITPNPYPNPNSNRGPNPSSKTLTLTLTLTLP